MFKLRQYELSGKEIEAIDVSDHCINVEAHPQMVKDYIVALRENARQWSASTKGRSEVNHSTQKPHKQKGTGRARQGSLAAPQFKGGGVVFGPKPKFDQKVKVNRKERQLVIKALLADKVKHDKVIVLNDPSIAKPKTKAIQDFLKTCGLEGKVLFLSESSFSMLKNDKQVAEEGQANCQVNLYKSIRNHPRCNFCFVNNVNGYDLMLAKHLVLTKSALSELKWVE